MASEQRGETDSLPKKIVKMTVIYILATLLALGLWTIRVRAENIIMVYLISVIILMIEIHQFLWGGIYTVICILSFNFFFTAPRYTLRVNDPNYIVTMVIFLIVSVITGLLVSKLREQVEVSQRNENRMKALFEISCGYLKLSGLDNIVYYVLKRRLANGVSYTLPKVPVNWESHILSRAILMKIWWIIIRLRSGALLTIRYAEPEQVFSPIPDGSICR